MSVSWQKLRVPLLERLALLDLAERRGETEEEALARLIHEAVAAECVRETTKPSERTEAVGEVHA